MFNFFADKLNVNNLGQLLAPTLTPEQQVHAAIEDGMVEKLKTLIEEEKVDANARNTNNNLPIHTASYHGQLECLKYLLTHNIDVNMLGLRDNTPLHFASAQGHLDTVKCLIDSGSNPALRNQSGKTAYDVASKDTIRQYLLPLQFKHEDPKVAKLSLPAGITPTADPDAPKPVLAPPPTCGMVYSPPPASGSTKSGRNATVFRPIQADGFGSSVGNAELTAKYGNTSAVKTTAPPPRLDANISLPTEETPTNVNRYSAGVNPYAQGRYTSYDVHTNTGSAVGMPKNGGAKAVSPPKFTVFKPNAAATPQNPQPAVDANDNLTSAPQVSDDTVQGMSNISLHSPEKPGMVQNGGDVHLTSIDLSSNPNALQ